MSRHRRQQRRRAGRARAELVARLALLEANWPSIVDSMYSRAGVSQMRAGEAVRNMNELQAQYGAEAREQMRSIVEGVASLNVEWPHGADREALDNIQPLSAESLNSPLVKMLPRSPNAVATADALFGALGFRRVE